MKNFTSILLIAIALLMFDSCKKAEETTPETEIPQENNLPDQEEFVMCKLNGADFLSNDDSRFHHYIDNTAGSEHMLNLRGSNVDVDGFTFLFWDFTGVGEYLIANDADKCAMQYTEGVPPTVTYESNQANASSGLTSGKIIVTVHSDTQIEGTFEFTAINNADPTDKITVTEGAFRINR